jgi:hypothetical protein
MNRRIIAIGAYVDYLDNIWQVTGSCIMGSESPMERYYCLTDADYDVAYVVAGLLEDAAVAKARPCDYIRLN